MMAFTPDGSILFFKYLFETIRISKYAQSGALPSYGASDLKIIKISLPFLPEQQKIAEFLTSIDKSIESKQQQITQAGQWKKGLMQGLFV